MVAVTAVQVDSRSIQQEGNCTWYRKPGQFSGGITVMGIRNESIIAALLDQHRILMHSKFYLNTHR